MTIIEAVIFGVLQGIAEFLPISSSGHLALAHNFFGKEYHGFAFDIALHFATLISVCIVYKKDVFALVKGFFTLTKKLFTGKIRESKTEGERLFIAVFVSALPLIPVKLFSADEKIEALSGISTVIGILLIFNAIMLFAGDKIKNGTKSFADGNCILPLGVGIIQATVGILPGISRSGSTITGSRLFGYSRKEAVRFSFLMSIPAIIGATASKIPEAFKDTVSASEILPVFFGMATAAITGFFAIRLLQYLSEKSYFVFTVYCIIIGTAAIVFG